MRSNYICIVFVLCLLACARSGSNGGSQTEAVEVVRAGVDSAIVRQSFISTLQPNYIAVIQPRVSGFLSAKLFSNGMPVRKGQVIFRIDDRQQRADMLAAKATLATAVANSIEAQNNYNRAVPLVAIDAISQAQFDGYRAQYEAAKASIASAEQALKNAQLEVEYTTIRATIDGVISASEAYVGDFVGPGSKFATLTRIENVDTLCCEVAIPMAQYLNLSGRSSFTYNNESLLSDIVLTLADGRQYPFVGSYSYTKSAVADTEGTIIIVVTFPNPHYLLKSGQFARVTTSIGMPKMRITVPQSALQQTQGEESVWVIDADSTVHYRKVTTLGAPHDGVVAVSGLAAGESVALDGSAKLTNGQKVKVL
ncbi:MAG: efflux RND transporter periplasmic adaptor subunit [Alistipes sp.]|nr:efflux RND transporter periplasmic adaptor subunit [Alistipes sp.]